MSTGISTETITSSPEATVALGQHLAARLRPPALVYLHGGLGAGKTTLVKGIVSGLGLAPPHEVRSPSFVFVHVFHNHSNVYHVDLFRIEHPLEAESLGLDDLLAERAIVIVEWAEKLAPGLVPDWCVHLEIVSDTERRIRIEETQPGRENRL